ncbi:MAG: (2Fe-2S)-binding protein [Alphaproteobacteria bacterium]
MLVRRSSLDPAKTVNLTIAGKPVIASVGESVAAAALAAGVQATRNAPISGAPRAPYCLMGVCFECLMTIDGKSNRQACMTLATEGMIVALQSARPSLQHD